MLVTVLASLLVLNLFVLIAELCITPYGHDTETSNRIPTNITVKLNRFILAIPQMVISVGVEHKNWYGKRAITIYEEKSFDYLHWIDLTDITFLESNNQRWLILISLQKQFEDEETQ